MPRAFDKATISRLRTAMRYSRRKMQKFREERSAGIKQMVGTHYGEEGSGKVVPVNLILLTIKTYLRHLVARRPRTLVRTDLPQLKGDAFKLQLALDQLMDDIKLGRTLELVALDALLGVGLCKVGIEENSVEVDGVYYDVGQPFADVVDLDNAVWDQAATSFDTCAYIGDRVRYPLDYFRESGLFQNVDAIARTSTTYKDTNEQGDPRSETISRGPREQEGDFEDYGEIWNLYFPLDRVTLSVPVYGEDDVIVRGPEDWTGPENGPYLMLGFGDVPNQIMPLPPIAAWREMHEMVNVGYRKLIKQAERQKELTVFRRGDEADADTIKKANDGDMIGVNDPGSIAPIRYGGPDQLNAFLVTQGRDWYSWLVGNLDSLAGLSPQSETLGQDQMLAESASKTMQDLQDRMKNFFGELARDLAWHMWYDPNIIIPLTHRVPGSEVDLEFEFDSEKHEGEFLDYNFTIDPYSAQYRSPGEMLAMTRNVWNQDVLPVAPLIAQDGGKLEVEKYLSAIARFANVPELSDLVSFGTPSIRQQLGPIGNPTPMAAKTERVNVRVNRSAGTRAGTDKVMQQALLGSASQGAEQGAALGTGNR